MYYSAAGSLPVGEASKRRRRERSMDHCVSRILQVLLPLLSEMIPGGLRYATPEKVATCPLPPASIPTWVWLWTPLPSRRL